MAKLFPIYCAQYHPTVKIKFGTNENRFNNIKRVRSGDSAAGFGFAVEFHTITSSMTLSIGLNIMPLKDDAVFQQNTTGGVKSSNMSGGTLFVEYVPKTNLGMRGTYNAAMNSNRSIFNGIDCRADASKLKFGPHSVREIGHTYGSLD